VEPNILLKIYNLLYIIVILCYHFIYKILVKINKMKLKGGHRGTLVPLIKLIKFYKFLVECLAPPFERWYKKKLKSIKKKSVNV